MDLERQYQNVTVPTLNTGGWYDLFQVGTVRNFQGMRSRGGTAQARQGAKLVMRPLAHAPAPGTPATAVGEVDFGPNNAFDLNAAALRFYDHYLKGLANGVDQDPSARRAAPRGSGPARSSA